jgi:hypothetical protein
MTMADSSEVDWLDSEAATEVMSMMVFQLSPIAHAFQKLGEPIPQKAEAEQAFVMRWLLKRVREHGDGWRKVAGDELHTMLDKIKALPGTGGDEP